jgi:hypothetical protein
LPGLAVVGAVLRVWRAQCLHIAFLAVTLFLGSVFRARAIPILRLHLVLRGRDDTKIMLRVLEIAFGRDRITAALGIARQLKIAVRDVLRRTAHLHVGPVRLVRARQRIGTTPVATPHALV